VAECVAARVVVVVVVVVDGMLAVAEALAEALAEAVVVVGADRWKPIEVKQTTGRWSNAGLCLRTMEHRCRAWSGPR
jgi:hypothetical protein